MDVISCYNVVRLEIEQLYLNKCRENPNTNYNFAYDARRPMAGKKHTLEARLKISNAVSGCGNGMFGKSPTIEHRQKISNSNMGKNKGNKHYNFGKHLDEELRRKISKSGTGLKRTDETKQNISKALTGRVFTSEHIQKLRNPNIKLRGSSHPNFNPTIYNLKNTRTNEEFRGTRHDFIEKYNIPSGRCSKLLNGKVPSIKKWILI